MISSYTSKKQEYDQRLREVSDEAKEVNLKLNKKKCQFGVNKVIFIEDPLTDNGVQPDPLEVSATAHKIHANQRPILEKSRDFLAGLCLNTKQSSYQTHQKTAPLRELLSEENEWSWGDKQEKV